MAVINYYPTSRVQTGLSTRGNLFTLNGAPYVGPYYLTYDGKAFSGVNPASGPNDLLEAIAASPTTQVSKRLGRNRDYKAANNIQQAYDNSPTIAPQVALKQLIPYYPVATESDYLKGYFNRYFAKKVNMNGYIMEISYENWAIITNRQDPTYEDYEVEKILWQLVGPLNDIRVSQYEIKGGVYDTNKRVVEAKTKTFRGLVEFIGGDYTKFARVQANEVASTGFTTTTRDVQYLPLGDTTNFIPRGVE